jgi:hypothetical protein
MPTEPFGPPPQLPASESFITSKPGKIIDNIINELIHHIEILDKRVELLEKEVKLLKILNYKN